MRLYSYKIISRNFKKGIDILLAVWYNIYIKGGHTPNKKKEESIMENTKIFEEAKKRYNTMMNDFALEHLTIGCRLSENTDNWNLRDMVSECQYQLDVCYEEGNDNNEGQYPDYWEITAEDILNKRKYDYLTSHNESEEELHKEWLSKTRRLRNFIRKYESAALTMECSEGHCSRFD